MFFCPILSGKLLIYCLFEVQSREKLNSYKLNLSLGFINVKKLKLKIRDKFWINLYIFATVLGNVVYGNIYNTGQNIASLIEIEKNRYFNK